MNKKPSSRGSDIDIEKCVESADGNRFNLILIAAQRAKEIKRRQGTELQGNHVSTCVTALLEVQEGKVDNRRYLAKV